jgi:hypothetical protein
VTAIRDIPASWRFATCEVVLDPATNTPCTTTIVQHDWDGTWAPTTCEACQQRVLAAQPAGHHHLALVG